MKVDKERIICAGFGGQGIMILGKLIAYSGMKNNLNVTWMPSYGAEVRGGTAHCTVVFSTGEIASPTVPACDTAIIMNGPSLDKFIKQITPGGLLILNSSLADAPIKRKDIKIVRVPMTDIAHSLGNVRVANMVSLGVYMKEKNLFPSEIVKKGIRIAFSSNKDLVTINLKALKKRLDQ